MTTHHPNNNILVGHIVQPKLAKHTWEFLQMQSEVYQHEGKCRNVKISTITKGKERETQFKEDKKENKHRKSTTPILLLVSRDVNVGKRAD